jgi:hypothetical protein
MLIWGILLALVGVALPRWRKLGAMGIERGRPTRSALAQEPRDQPKAISCRRLRDPSRLTAWSAKVLPHRRHLVTSERCLGES